MLPCQWAERGGHMLEQIGYGKLGDVDADNVQIELGEIQQGVENPFRPPGCLVNLSENATNLAILHLLLQQLDPQPDRLQRLAQVVAGRRKEPTSRPAGLLCVFQGGARRVCAAYDASIGVQRGWRVKAQKSARDPAPTKQPEMKRALAGGSPGRRRMIERTKVPPCSQIALVPPAREAFRRGFVPAVPMLCAGTCLGRVREMTDRVEGLHGCRP